MRSNTFRTLAISVSLGMMLSTSPTQQAHAAGESADCAIWIFVCLLDFRGAVAPLIAPL